PINAQLNAANDALGLGKTNVPQFTSNQVNTVSTKVQGQGNEVQNITFGTLGTLRFTYSGDPTPGDLAISGATTAAQVQTSLSTIGALNGNIQVLGAPGGPFLVRFINNLARVNVADLG